MSILSPTKKKKKREIREAPYVVAAAFPVLATVALAVVLVAAAVVAAVPRCRCHAALALATTVTVNLATTVTTISCCPCRVALVLPRLPHHRPHSCCHSIALNLAAVVVAALPPPWPLLPSSPPPLLPRNPRPCHPCQCRDTPLLPPHRPRSSCCCRLPCPPSPFPLRPCPPLPSCPRPSALAPSRPRLAFACVTLTPRCRCQQQPLLLPLTITINFSAQLTTTTNIIHWTSFLIKGGNGSHCRLQRRSMTVAAMASLALCYLSKGLFNRFN